MRFNDCSDDEELYSGYGSAYTLEKAVRDPMNAANTTSNDHGSSLARAVNDYPSRPSLGGLRSLLNGLDYRLSNADADLDFFGARAATCSRVDVSVGRYREPNVAR
ncbi:hypothetical protein E0Z10_g10231 [Xylaria hypoxylon]|uniref:Uncharacterized protein n=1 Tax=Xylaria hypoxylon TaxID=37992 RepID=A0A4Z0YH09_9PEZI|nr:hypothetical protein E0Z10_g10231 [Xylaria hypoxylon]